MDSFPYVLVTLMLMAMGLVCGIAIGEKSEMPDTNAKVCSQLYEKRKGYENCLKRNDINKNIGMIRSIDNDR